MVWYRMVRDLCAPLVSRRSGLRLPTARFRFGQRGEDAVQWRGSFGKAFFAYSAGIVWKRVPQK